MKPRKAAVIFIFVTVTLDMLALGLIAPVLPKLVLNFLGGDAASAAKMFGIFGTVFALMQFVFSPLLGVLSDRCGRRPVIVLSNLGLGLDYVLMALAPQGPRLAARIGLNRTIALGMGLAETGMLLFSLVTSGISEAWKPLRTIVAISSRPSASASDTAR